MTQYTAYLLITLPPNYNFSPGLLTLSSSLNEVLGESIDTHDILQHGSPPPSLTRRQKLGSLLKFLGSAEASRSESTGTDTYL